MPLSSPAGPSGLPELDPHPGYRLVLPDRPRPIVLVGAGGIVRDAHLPAYAKAGFTVASLTDLDQDRARTLADAYGIAETYGDGRRRRRPRPGRRGLRRRAAARGAHRGARGAARRRGRAAAEAARQRPRRRRPHPRGLPAQGARRRGQHPAALRPVRRRRARADRRRDDRRALRPRGPGLGEHAVGDVPVRARPAPPRDQHAQRPLPRPDPLVPRRPDRRLRGDGAAPRPRPSRTPAPTSR